MSVHGIFICNKFNYLVRVNNTLIKLKKRNEYPYDYKFPIYKYVRGEQKRIIYEELRDYGKIGLTLINYPLKEGKDIDSTACDFRISFNHCYFSKRC